MLSRPVPSSPSVSSSGTKKSAILGGSAAVELRGVLDGACAVSAVSSSVAVKNSAILGGSATAGLRCVPEDSDAESSFLSSLALKKYPTLYVSSSGGISAAFEGAGANKSFSSSVVWKKTAILGGSGTVRKSAVRIIWFLSSLFKCVSFLDRLQFYDFFLLLPPAPSFPSNKKINIQ